jgi:hypothetical protein
MKKVNYWLISFNDLNETLNNLSDLGVEISDKTKNNLSLTLKSSAIVGELMPIKFGADIYFRAANQMIRYVEIETGVNFKKYKRNDYTL